MSGAIEVLDRATLITADRNVDTLAGGGAHAAATFLLNITAIDRTTGTLNVTLSWNAGSGNEVFVAGVFGISATGLVRIPLNANFASTRDAIPEPSNVDWDLSGDTTDVSGSVVAIYGD